MDLSTGDGTVAPRKVETPQVLKTAISVRLDAKLKKLADEAAAEQRRTFTSYLEYALQEQLKRDGKLRK